MVDDRPEENGSLPDQERPKRAPPTIDLEATEVSSAPPHASGDTPSEPAPEEPERKTHRSSDAGVRRQPRLTTRVC